MSKSDDQKKSGMGSRLDAIRLMKALSDKSRLEVLDRLKQGPAYVEALAAALELAPSTISFHLRKLEDVGLVEGKKEQYYVMYRVKGEVLDKTLTELLAIGGSGEVFRDREEQYRQKILDSFLKDGKLKNIPVQRKKKRVILEELAARFEVGREYPEKEVNLIIADFHDDFCTLRRELIDERLMERASGVYRRT